MKTWKIYVHINKINGKLYIGQTGEKNVNKRWNGGMNYSDSPYFWNAIQKYGWDNFDHLILIDNISTVEEANLIEQFLIKKYNTNNRSFGYNIEKGGLNHSLSEETKQKISQHHILAHQAKPEVQMVKKEFEKVKNNLDSFKVKPNSTKNTTLPRYKYICIETQKIYDSSILAEKDTGISARSIRAVCKGEQKTAKNTHWDYYEEGKEYKIENYINKNQKYSRKGKKVYCKELDIVFNSGTEAARYVGLQSAVHIFNCCNGTRQTCKGFHWSYAPKEEC